MPAGGSRDEVPNTSYGRGPPGVLPGRGAKPFGSDETVADEVPDEVPDTS